MGIPGRRLISCVAAVLGITLLSGCGSSGTSGVGNAVSQTAAPKITTAADLAAAMSKATGPKNTAKVALTMEVESDGQHITGTGAGLAQLKPLAFDTTMTMNVASTDGSGTASGQLEFILANNTLYLKPSGVFADGLQQLDANVGNKPWIKIDQNGTDPVSQSFGSFLTFAQDENDPGYALDKTKSAATLASTKQEQLDGQSTTHYTVTVDLKKYAASLSDTDPEKQSVNEDLQTGVNNQTVDIWVNSENLPLKLVVAEGKTGTVTATYADWGAPASITAPPAAQVAIP
ncbi:MAG TPA: hypothetical protein VF444_01770 [Pseudonocardiaceae bacterium]